MRAEVSLTETTEMPTAVQAPLRLTDEVREQVQQQGGYFFLIGLLALPFAPETKGQPLPD